MAPRTLRIPLAPSHTKRSVSRLAGVLAWALAALPALALPPAIRPIGAMTIPALGAAQGAFVHAGNVYILADADTGIIQTFEIEPGVEPGATIAPEALPPIALHESAPRVALTRLGEDLLPHPTGLAIHPELGPAPGVFLGDTVRRMGLIWSIDWHRAMRDADLDDAIRNVCLDDLATNGTRPIYVRYQGRWLIATADYGPEGNELRLYDPERLKRAARTSAPGVLVARFPCGPFVQSLCWIDSRAVLVLVQNQTAGKGHRLTFIDLESVEPGADLRALPAIDLAETERELEGFCVLRDEGDRSIAMLLNVAGEGNAELVELSWK